MKKVGLLVTVAPEDARYSLVIDALERFKTGTAQIYAYFLDEGVRALDRPEILELGQSGAKLSACALACELRGLPRNSDLVYGGLGLLAEILSGAEEVVSV